MMSETVQWNDAVAHISRVLDAKRALSPVLIIGITGPVGAGKSTLAGRLTPCILATDNYLPDYDTIPYHERDLPHHADFVKLAADLEDLRHGQPIQAPVWSFKTHRREGYRQLVPASIVACEGIHALHAPVVPLLDLRVFVEAPRGVRWSRWEHLEATGQRGWGVEKAREFFDAVAEPTFASAERAYRECADVIVVNE